MNLTTYIDLTREQSSLYRKLIRLQKWMIKNPRTVENYQKYDCIFLDYQVYITQYFQLRKHTEDYENEFCQRCDFTTVLKHILNAKA